MSSVHAAVCTVRNYDVALFTQLERVGAAKKVNVYAEQYAQRKAATWGKDPV